MKVLLDHIWPFLLAHGGVQTQIEQTKAALETVGVDVECVRWWDEQQSGDVIHFFGRPMPSYVQLAQQKGYKVVMSDLMSGLGVRSHVVRRVQKVIKIAAEHLLGHDLTQRLGWVSFRLADACVALTAWEAQLMREMFDVRQERLHIVPNGVEQVFLQSRPSERGRWLVCTSTITPIKRPLELAAAAVDAGTPLWIIGRPFTNGDPYVKRFLQFAREHSECLRYEGPIDDRSKLAEIYRQARGFVLLSRFESLSLSALEAAACGCPLLLGDLPWARCTFGDQAAYCPVDSRSQAAASLRQFYEQAPTRVIPNRPLSWTEVAERLKGVYESLVTDKP